MERDRKRVALIILAFLVLCLVVSALALRTRISQKIVRVIDRTPPHAEFAFRTANSQISGAALEVRPGEEFVPLIKATDNIAGELTVEMWMTEGANPAGASRRVVVPGAAMSLHEPGPYHLHATVTDESDNTSTFSTIIAVYEKAGPAPDALLNGSAEWEGSITIDQSGTHATGNVNIAVSQGIFATIENANLLWAGDALTDLDVIILLSSVIDLSRLELGYVSLFPLDERQAPIPSAGWTLIKPSSAEYIAEKNVWRLRFRWTYDSPLPKRPTAWRISAAVQLDGNYKHIFATTEGVESNESALQDLFRMEQEYNDTHQR